MLFIWSNDRKFHDVVSSLGGLLLRNQNENLVVSISPKQINEMRAHIEAINFRVCGRTRTQISTRRLLAHLYAFGEQMSTCETNLSILERRVVLLVTTQMFISDA
jgi:hypothetical protein